LWIAGGTVLTGALIAGFLAGTGFLARKPESEKTPGAGKETTGTVSPQGDYALEFDGLEGSVEIPDLPYDGGDITLEARVRMGKLTGDGRQIVAGHGEGLWVSLWGYPPLAGISLTGPTQGQVAICEWESLDVTRPLHVAGVVEGTHVRI